MAERIRVMNVYTNNRHPWRVVKWIQNDKIRISLISELDSQFLEPMRSAGRLLTRLGATRAEDTAILVRGSRRLRRRMDYMIKQVSPFIPRPGSEKPMLWRNRDIVRAIDHKRKRVYYSVHLNAAIGNDEGRWLNNAGAVAAIRAMEWLMKDAERWLKEDFIVNIGGDFNIRSNRHCPWNPAWVAAELGLNWQTDGRVMYFMWSNHPKYKVEVNVTYRVPGADAHRTLTAVRKRRWRFRRRS